MQIFYPRHIRHDTHHVRHLIVDGAEEVVEQGVHGPLVILPPKDSAGEPGHGELVVEGVGESFLYHTV